MIASSVWQITLPCRDLLPEPQPANCCRLGFRQTTLSRTDANSPILMTSRLQNEVPLCGLLRRHVSMRDAVLQNQSHTLIGLKDFIDGSRDCHRQIDGRNGWLIAQCLIGLHIAGSFPKPIDHTKWITRKNDEYRNADCGVCQQGCDTKKDGRLCIDPCERKRKRNDESEWDSNGRKNMKDRSYQAHCRYDNSFRILARGNWGTPKLQSYKSPGHVQ